MSAIVNQISQDILKKFIPLNTLPSAHLAGIWNECAIEECVKGTVLFEQGDEAKEFIYLISGMISLYAGDMEMETIVTGSEAARFAIAHHIPRKVKAVTKSKARIVRIPTCKLDTQRSEDTGQTYLVDEIEDEGGDWMTTMLQSPVFQRLPAANLQKVMMQMEEVAFEPGEIVVKQGDEADFYYIIKSGDCELIRQATEGARPVKLAELHSCDAFGEDALLSGNPRNVTVRMKGKGQMLRLSKANFISLVKEPVLQYVSFDEGQQKVNEGASWLDVRGADIYEQGCIKGSINIPFFSLRMKIAELRHDQLQVLVCEKGRTSEAAAFLLLKFGFNALILKGGMEGVKKSTEVLKPEETPVAPIKPEMSIVEKNTAPVVGVDDPISKELLAEAQNKISELERLCAQSNEKLNALELEKSNLQQQADEQAQLVVELQVSSQAYAEKLDAANANNSNDNAELQESLFSEKEKNISLNEELENKQAELNGVSQEVENTRLNLEAAKQKLAEKTAQAAEKDASLAEKQLGFEQLENRLSNAESESAQLSQQLEQKELDLNQQITELRANNELLLAEKETNVKLTAELTNKNIELGEVFQEAQSSHEELLTVQQDLKELSSKLSAKNELLAANELALQRIKGKEQSSVVAIAEQVELSDKLQKDVEASSAQLESSKADVLSLERQLSEMRERADSAEASLNAVASGKETLESELTERFAQMESNLSEAVEGKNTAEQQLNDAADQKSALQQQLTVFESELSSRSEANEQLKNELEFVRQQLDAYKQNESAEQSKSNDLLQQASVLEKELVATKDELSSIKEQLTFGREDNEGLKLKASNAESVFENASEQNKRLSGQLEKLSAGQQSEGALAEQKIQAISEKLSTSEEERGVLIGQLEELGGKLSSISSVAEKAEADLSELKHKRLSNDGELTAAQQQIEALELSLKAAVEEKELLIATSNKDSDEKFSQLTEKVLRSEGMANNLQLKVDELSVLRSEREKKLASLEKQLEAINVEKEGLHQRTVEAERVVSKQSDSADDRARIIELEKQLDDANSALMDLELMVETSAVKVDDALSEDEKGELQAVQSELNLVREQTEKDIQAMYVKLENSEKMNLALKRKVLSMQALVNQEVAPEQPSQEKKKGWWRK